jgi:uncharacterized protein YkwD
MSIRALRLAVVFVAACLSFSPLAHAASCGAGLSGQFSQQVNAARPSQDLFNAAMLHYLNLERCRHGLSPLADNGRLQSAAEKHSRNMAADHHFSHQSNRAGQQTLSMRLKAAGLRPRMAGENIAMDKLYAIIGRPISVKMSGACQFTYATGEPVPAHSYKSLAQQVVARLMQSSGHRANILNPRFTSVGSGISVDRGGAACGDVYVTQDFAS